MKYKLNYILLQGTPRALQMPEFPDLKGDISDSANLESLRNLAGRVGNGQKYAGYNWKQSYRGIPPGASLEQDQTGDDKWLRLAVWSFDSGTYYLGQWFNLYSNEWVTSLADGWDSGPFVYTTKDEALKIPREMKKDLMDRVTKSYVMSVKNLETRRKLKEWIGTEKFLKCLDVDVINEETDDLGKPMKLYKTKTTEEGTAGKNKWGTNTWTAGHFYFLMVTDSSTDREYYIQVRPCSTCSEAKASTFDNKKLYARQGDIGVINLSVGPDGKLLFKGNKPIIET